MLSYLTQGVCWIVAIVFALLVGALLLLFVPIGAVYLCNLEGCHLCGFMDEGCRYYRWYLFTSAAVTGLAVGSIPPLVFYSFVPVSGRRAAPMFVFGSAVVCVVLWICMGAASTFLSLPFILSLQNGPQWISVAVTLIAAGLVACATYRQECKRIDGKGPTPRVIYLVRVGVTILLVWFFVYFFFFTRPLA